MPKQTDRDAVLVRAMQRGDEAALGEIIERYTGYVGAIVWGILKGRRSESDAKEVLADTFYSLWTHAGNVNPATLRGYLASIARSKAINALRRAGEELPLEEDRITLSVPGPEDETLRRETYAALRRALDEMGEPDRTIFIRHYYFCRSAREIGEELGINRNTVTTKLRRGRERLRAQLEKEGYFIG